MDCLFVANGELGTSRFAYALNCRGLEVTLIEDTYDRKKNLGEHGCVRLRIIRDAKRARLIDDEERLLYVAKNDGGKWIFHSSGEPLSFEKTEYYSNPKIRDRFTSQILDEYLKAMGINMLDEDFYGHQMAFAGYKNKFSDSGYEKKTYANYHLIHGLKYGREY
ncbi:hypothetical protein FACS189443_4430 [Planctomycetales bacterium]|nr:hypothetical protein FACS189443_4430 [Planctomycetales bacterium]